MLTRANIWKGTRPFLLVLVLLLRAPLRAEPAPRRPRYHSRHAILMRLILYRSIGNCMRRCVRQ